MASWMLVVKASWGSHGSRRVSRGSCGGALLSWEELLEALQAQEGPSRPFVSYQGPPGGLLDTSFGLSEDSWLLFEAPGRVWWPSESSLGSPVGTQRHSMVFRRDSLWALGGSYRCLGFP